MPKSSWAPPPPPTPPPPPPPASTTHLSPNSFLSAYAENNPRHSSFPRSGHSNSPQADRRSGPLFPPFSTNSRRIVLLPLAKTRSKRVLSSRFSPDRDDQPPCTPLRTTRLLEMCNRRIHFHCFSLPSNREMACSLIRLIDGLIVPALTDRRNFFWSSDWEEKTPILVMSCGLSSPVSSGNGLSLLSMIEPEVADLRSSQPLRIGSPPTELRISLFFPLFV